MRSTTFPAGNTRAPGGKKTACQKLTTDAPEYGTMLYFRHLTLECGNLRAAFNIPIYILFLIVRDRDRVIIRI